MKSIKIFLRQIKMLTTQTREFIAPFMTLLTVRTVYVWKKPKSPLISTKCFWRSETKRKSEFDKDLFEANQDVDDTNKGVYCPLYDIIEGPNSICMKETKIPFDFYKMFSRLWKLKEKVNSIKIFLKQIKMLTTQTRESIAQTWWRQ